MSAEATVPDGVETRTVSVIHRPKCGPDCRCYHGAYLKTVTVLWFCPVCGGPRGEPVARNQCYDGEWWAPHEWTNPCGHVDRYAAVIREAEPHRGEAAR